MNHHSTYHSEAARLSRKAANMRILQLAIRDKDPLLAARISLEAGIVEQRALMLLGYP